MLKKLMGHVRSRSIAATPDMVAEAELLLVPQKTSATAAAKAQPARSRQSRSMRDSDIKDEYGRSAEEIAAEAAKEFDLEGVMRRAAAMPERPDRPVSHPGKAPPIIVAAAAAQAQGPTPVHQGVNGARLTTRQLRPYEIEEAQVAAQAIHGQVASPVQAAIPQQVAPSQPPAAVPPADPEAGHIFLPGPGSAAATRGAAARSAYWDAIGASDDALLRYDVSPESQGFPAWPAKEQQYRIIRTHGSAIIASEGLSDPFGPFDNRNRQNGFGVEVYIEVIGWQDMPAEALQQSWAFKAVEHIAKIAAYTGKLAGMVAGHEVLSIDIPEECAPEGWVAPGIAEPAGALLNVAQPRGRNAIPDMPLSEVAVVPITPIYPEELESCILEGTKERRALANDLLASGYGHRMQLGRTSLR